MYIHVNGKNIEITDAIKAYVKEKLGKVANHYDQITGMDVIEKSQEELQLTKEYDLWKRIHQKQRERSMCDSFTFFHRCLRSYSQSHRLHISSGTRSLT